MFTGAEMDEMIERTNRALAKADLEAERAGNLENEVERLRDDISKLAYTATRKAEELEHLKILLGGIEKRLRQETASNQDTSAITLDAIADTIGVALRPGWKPSYK